jgi:hypothetical protein
MDRETAAVENDEIVGFARRADMPLRSGGVIF